MDLAKAVIKIIKIFPIVLIVLCISSCISPHPFSSKQQLINLNNNIDKLNAARHPLPKNLTLNEAIARALKYNLDYQAQLSEQAIALADMGVSNANMLPNLVASAGYLSRNNLNEVLSPGGQISTSENMNRSVRDLNFSWNILDFGVSYFESKQKGDQVIIAEEKERKIMQRISKDTQKAFWRTYAAEHYLQMSKGYKQAILKTIKNSYTAEKEKLLPPADAARARRDLWTLYDQLISFNFEVSRFEPELMSLMSAPGGESTTLNVYSNRPQDIAKNLPHQLRHLEKLSLYYRPELAEENYRTRISMNEINKARLRLLPGLELGLGSHYDSNSFLVNNNWNQLSLSATWNIFKLLSNYKQYKLSKKQAIFTKKRRLALSLAIVTQVDIAKLNYNYTKENLYSNDQILNNEQQLYQSLLKRKEGFENKFTLVKARGSLILAQLKRDIAYADYQTASAELVNSIGLDPVYSINAVKLPLDQLTKLIALQNTVSIARNPYITNIMVHSSEIN